MKIHYYYSRGSGGFHDIRLRALMEEEVWTDGKQEFRFTYIEELKIFISTDMTRFHNATFKIDFGKNSCMGHWAKSRNELYKAMSNDCGHIFKPITQNKYLRLRKVAFAIYQRETCMNFDLVAKKQDYSITIL